MKTIATTLLTAILLICFGFNAHAQFAGGSGTEEDPYQVENVDQLQEIQDHTDAHFIQVDDIDASETETWNDGAGFNPIGDDVVKFTGSYDGNGYVIEGLSIDRPGERDVGLFGSTDGGEISEVGITDSYVRGRFAVGSLVGINDGTTITDSYVTGDVTSRANSIGGLVGHNGGDISGSYAEVDVSGQYQVGGLVGSNLRDDISGSHATGDVSGEGNTGGLVGSNWKGDISGSYATGNVSGEDSNVGGLVGRNREHISGSYATGNVSGNESIGGLVGSNTDGGSVFICFSIGKVNGTEEVGGLVGFNDETIEDSYWDKDSSSKDEGVGQGLSEGVTGLSAEEITGATAEDNMVGFDFTKIWESVDASDEDAAIDGHPILQALDRQQQVDAQKLTAPSIVELQLPEDEAEPVEHSPELVWMEADRAETYHLQLAEASDFSEPVVDVADIGNTEYQLTEELKNGTSYYWRVKAGNEVGDGDWSDFSSFTTLDVPETPLTQSPEDSSMSLTPPTEFKWDSVEFADEYNLRIYKNEVEEGHILIDTVLTETSYVFNNFAHTNDYYWTVHGINSAGDGEASEPKVFSRRIISPDLTYPAPGDEGVDRYPKLKWTSVEQASGYQIEVAEDSLFENLIDDIEISGDNEITIGPLEWKTSYYWRAYTIGDIDTSFVTEPVDFTVGQPIISFEPESLEFGKIQTGNIAEHAVEIFNTGSDSLFIEEVGIPDDRVELILPDSLQPGSDNGLPVDASVMADVVIDGNEPGEIDGPITIDDGLGTTGSLPVNAFIGRAELVINPDTLSFPSTRVGQSTQKPVQLTNTGNDTLQIESVTVSDVTYSSNFNNFTLLPDEEIADTVVFAPSEDPASEGHLTYRHADDTRDTLFVTSNTVPIASEPEDQHHDAIGEEPTKEVVITGEDSFDPDGGELSFAWHLLSENEDILLSEESELVFDAPVGTHHVELQVTDEQDATDSSRIKIDVVSYSREMDSAVEAGITAYGDADEYNLFIADISYTDGVGSNMIEVDHRLHQQFSLTVSNAVRTAVSVAADSSVFITNGPNLNGYDKQGTELWSSKGLGAIATVTPTIDTSEERIYVGVSNENLFAYDYKSGENIWTYRVDAPISASAVITRERKLIFPTEAGTLYGFDLTENSVQEGTNDLEPTWQENFQDSVVHAPAIDAEDNVIVGTLEGNLLQLGFGSDGNVNILWEEPICSRITVSPVIDGDGNIYTGCEDGTLHKIDGTDGSLVWSYETNGKITATPAISEYGRIYFGNDAGELNVLTTEGDHIWQYEGSGSIQADLLHIAGTTYIGTMGGYVRGFYDGGGSEEFLADIDNTPDSEAEQSSKEKRASTAVLIQLTETISEPTPPIWGTYMGNNRRTGGARDEDEATSTFGDPNEVPDEYSLAQNYPNPFNPTTQINYKLPEQASVTLKIYNTLGQRVATLINETQSPGEHQVTFDASGLSSGVYLYRLQADGFVETKQMMFLK